MKRRDFHGQRNDSLRTQGRYRIHARRLVVTALGASVAAYLPAWRATIVDPRSALQ